MEWRRKKRRGDDDKLLAKQDWRFTIPVLTPIQYRVHVSFYASLLTIQVYML